MNNHNTDGLPFKELKEEATKRQESFSRREDAYHAYHTYKRPTNLKR